jgi:hypothetical protein
MRETATEEHYRRLLEVNRSLADGGARAIELVALEWGPVAVDGARAELTTFETWRTTLADGSTLEARERNVYTLAYGAGGWRIEANANPDDGAVAPAPTPPVASAAPPTLAPPAGSGSSRNWSGYAARGGPFTAVTGSWTVPETQSSGSFGSSASWVGIGGLGSRDLIQAGTSVQVTAGGPARYQAWVETLPEAARSVPLAVRPGDAVTVSIAEQAPSQWRIEIKNQTTGRSYSTTEQYTSSRSSVEWIQEPPTLGGRLAPLDNFGTVRFSDGSAVKNGQTVTLAGAGARPITLTDRAGRALAVPSGVDEDGASFSVTRTANAPETAPAPSRGRRGARFPNGTRSGAGG